MVSLKTSFSTSGCRPSTGAANPRTTNPAVAIRPVAIGTTNLRTRSIMVCSFTAGRPLLPPAWRIYTAGFRRPANLLNPATPGLNLTPQLVGRSVCRLQPESFSGLSGCVFQLSTREIKLAKHHISIRQWLQFEGGFGLFAGPVSISGPLAHFSQSRMRHGTFAVGGHCRVIQPLGFKQEATIEIILRLCGQFRSALVRCQ